MKNYSLQLTCDALRTGRKVVWVGRFFLFTYVNPPSPLLLPCLPAARVPGWSVVWLCPRRPVMPLQA